MKRKKVLLVDDDPLVRRVVALTLGEEYDTLQADNGRSALAIAEAERPDLILMDIQMPRMSGLRACRLLKSSPSTSAAVVIMLTGRSARSDQAAAMRAGADGFFGKPFSPLELLDRVQECFK